MPALSVSPCLQRRLKDNFMFNLLSQNQKNIVKQDYLARRTVVVLLFVLVCTVIIFVGLLPSYILSFYKERTASSFAGSSANVSEATKTLQDMNKALTDTSSQISLLQKNLPKISPYDLLALVVKDKTANIKITSISFSGGQNGTAQFSVGGIAKDRQSLLDFEKNLQNESKFSSVDLPVSGFSQDSNINFSVNLGVKQ